MSWSTPETAWLATEGLTNTDMNAIGENLNVLHKGNGQASISTLNSASSLNIGSTESTFFMDLNAGPNVNYIYKANRQPGNHITLITLSTSAAITYVRLAASPPTDYASINYPSGTATIPALGFARFVYDGTYWILDIDNT